MCNRRERHLRGCNQFQRSAKAMIANILRDTAAILMSKTPVELSGGHAELGSQLRQLQTRQWSEVNVLAHPGRDACLAPDPSRASNHGRYQFQHRALDGHRAQIIRRPQFRSQPRKRCPSGDFLGDLHPLGMPLHPFSSHLRPQLHGHHPRSRRSVIMGVRLSRGFEDNRSRREFARSRANLLAHYALQHHRQNGGLMKMFRNSRRPLGKLRHHQVRKADPMMYLRRSKSRCAHGLLDATRMQTIATPSR